MPPCSYALRTRRVSRLARRAPGLDLLAMRLVVSRHQRRKIAQRDAADALAVHPKTIAYRLEKIETISGLSLRNHEHRILFDLALKVHDLGITTLKS